jgi:ribosomal protein S18 acetylase RimI-like enzyme
MVVTPHNGVTTISCFVQKHSRERIRNAFAGISGPGQDDAVSTSEQTAAPEVNLKAHPLDHPVWNSLTTSHAAFAEAPPSVAPECAGALRYAPDMSPFAALRPNVQGEPVIPDHGWADLLALTDPGVEVLLSGPSSMLATRPSAWTVTMDLPGVQMIATDVVTGKPDPEAVVLGPTEVDEMLDLVSRTEPGPFLPNTFRMGTYLGIRRGGDLIAMAGERMRPPGWTEISAVCTLPEYRGQGLAGRLVQAVAHGIRARDEIPFLHAAAENVNAIRMYESLGFRLRLRPGFYALIR